MMEFVHTMTLVMLVFVTQTNIAIRTPTTMERWDQLDDLDSCTRDFTDLCMAESTCAGLCGESISEDPEVFAKTCSCDALCLLYNDCCFNFEEMCPEEMTKFNRSNVRHLLGIKARSVGRYLALSSCAVSKLLHIETANGSARIGQQHTQDIKPEDVDIISNVKLCNADAAEYSSEDVSDDIYDEIDKDEEGGINTSFGCYDLVTDKTTGLTYSNQYVYRCKHPNQHDDNMIKWDKKYSSDQDFTLDELADFFTNGKTTDTFKKALLDVPPVSAVLRLSPPENAISCLLKCGQHHEWTVNNFNRVCKKLMLKTDYLTDSLPSASSTESSSRHANNEHVHFAGSRIKRQSDVFETLDHRCSMTHTYKNAGNGNMYNEFPTKFSALMSLSGPTKMLTVDSKSNYFTGGWDRYSCRTKKGQDRCQMTFSCNQNAAYVRDNCVKPKAILIKTRTTFPGKASLMGFDLMDEIFKRLRFHNDFRFKYYQHLEDLKDDNESVNYAMFVNPKLSVVSKKDSKISNRYKDIIEHTFNAAKEQWVGRASICYIPNNYKMSLTELIPFLKEENHDNNIVCDDIDERKKYTPSKQLNNTRPNQLNNTRPNQMNNTRPNQLKNARPNQMNNTQCNHLNNTNLNQLNNTQMCQLNTTNGSNEGPLVHTLVAFSVILSSVVFMETAV